MEAPLGWQSVCCLLSRKKYRRFRCVASFQAELCLIQKLSLLQTYERRREETKQNSRAVVYGISLRGRRCLEAVSMLQNIYAPMKHSCRPLLRSYRSLKVALTSFALQSQTCLVPLLCMQYIGIDTRDWA